MFMNVELMVDEKLIRGDVRTPEETGHSQPCVFTMDSAWTGLVL